MTFQTHNLEPIKRKTGFKICLSNANLQRYSGGGGGGGGGGRDFDAPDGVPRHHASSLDYTHGTGRPAGGVGTFPNVILRSQNTDL
jgi:hypothetical protein